MLDLFERRTTDLTHCRVDVPNTNCNWWCSKQNLLDQQFGDRSKPLLHYGSDLLAFSESALIPIKRWIRTKIFGNPWFIYPERDLRLSPQEYSFSIHSWRLRWTDFPIQSSILRLVALRQQSRNIRWIPKMSVKASDDN